MVLSNIWGFKKEKEMRYSTYYSKTYPLSRGAFTAENIIGGSFPGRLYRNALEGRLNKNSLNPLVSDEFKLIIGLKKGDDTHLPARVITSNLGSAVTAMALAGLGSFLLRPKNSGMLLSDAFTGGGLGYSANLLNRIMYSRAMEGRTSKNRKGWTTGDKKFLEQLKHRFDDVQI